MSDLKRLEDKVSIEPNSGCWLWTGSVNQNGYGQFSVERKTTGAHRASWRLHVGPIPEGMHVCHHCDNPPCVNPQHLFLGTNLDNIADKTKKGRVVSHFATANRAKTVCSKGHPYEGANLYLTPEGERACKACRAQAAVNRRARQKAADYAKKADEVEGMSVKALEEKHADAVRRLDEIFATVDARRRPMTLKPAAWMCPECLDVCDHDAACSCGWRAEKSARVPLFTRDDLVRVAFEASMGRAMDRTEEAEKLVNEMLGEVEK